MEQMRHTRDRIEELTPKKVESFIASKECDALLLSLDHLDRRLLGRMDSQLFEEADLYRGMRNAMIAYVGRVRGCLKGQSSPHILRRC